jgi:hypothetical protein
MLMGCREYRTRLIELARGAVDAAEGRVLQAHVESCAECARVLDGQLALSTALDSMAGQALPEMGAIEDRVMAEFDRAMVRRASQWVWVAALAAALCLGVVLLNRRQPAVRQETSATAVEAPEILRAPAQASSQASSLQRVAHHNKAAARRASDDNQPFVPIPYTVPLSPEERTSVVRMEIPVSWLISVGFNVQQLDPGAIVEADVLVSQDGRARAIRVLSVK